MPPLDKADRRDRRRAKEIDSKYRNVRYRSLRAGLSLVRSEVERKTTLEGKKVRRVRRRP